jgi:hypothetical protein
MLRKKLMERSNFSIVDIAGAEARAHLMGFIGTAEAVPLLQSPFARVWTGFSAACKARVISGSLLRTRRLNAR